MNDESTIESLGYRSTDRAPNLKCFYGIGTALYGKGMVDKEANLYSKIYFFTILYIPILYLGRYLIHGRDGGEYVVGQASPPTLAKFWNIAIIVVLLSAGAIVGYQEYSNSPLTIAANQLRQGRADIEAGNFARGLSQLRSVYRSNTRHGTTAEQQLRAMANNAYIANLDPAVGAVVIEQFLEMPELFPDLLSVAESLLEPYAAVNLLAAKQLVVVLLALEGDQEKRLVYEQQHYAMLQQLTEEDPASVALAVEFAGLDEVYNQCQRCEAILTPHQQNLGLSEGARILGQLYAYNGRYEGAYALLRPYVTEGLNNYHRLEAEYNQLSEKIWDEMIEFLNSPNAPQSFYDQYNDASEADQDRLLNEFYLSRLQTSEPYQLAEKNYQASTAVVSVALDLGIVMLNRAIAMSDPELRQQELQSAEQTFLAVKGQAEDSDDYQLYLGQVYYWLGNEEKGKGLFDALLEKYTRSSSVLYSLSAILRDLGELGQAKSYASEAYENSTDIVEKQSLAMHLAVMADTIDEKIEWLEKADSTNLRTKADLLSARASKALDEDDESGALALYDQSIAVYKEMPEDSTSLNNSAIVYLAKYRVGRDEADYQRGLDLMDRAILLDPDDSIILSNSIDNHLEKAVRDVLSDSMDIAAMETRPRLDLFSSLYDNYEQKQVYINQLLAHQSMQKALGYTNKVLLLSPKSVGLAGQSLALFYFLDRQAEMETLASRLASIDFDLSESEAQIASYREQKDVSDIREALDKSDRRYRQQLSKLDPATHAREIRVLNAYLVENQLTALAYNLDVDLDRLLANARAAVKQEQTAQTRNNLQTALLHQTINALAAADSGFAEFHTQQDLYFDLKIQLALYTLRQPEFAQRVVAQAPFQEWLQLAAHSSEHYPYVTDVQEWFMLDVLKQELADKMLAKMRATKH
jgi:tetratricopeptide (TPR) repeat protein